jgi:hypothetical protein
MERKPRWAKAQLVVLSRATTQESVLGFCKVAGQTGPGFPSPGPSGQCFGVKGFWSCLAQTGT